MFELNGLRFDELGLLSPFEYTEGDDEWYRRIESYFGSEVDEIPDKACKSFTAVKDMPKEPCISLTEELAFSCISPEGLTPSTRAVDSGSMQSSWGFSEVFTPVSQSENFFTAFELEQRSLESANTSNNTLPAPEFLNGNFVASSALSPAIAWDVTSSQWVWTRST